MTVTCKEIQVTVTLCPFIWLFTCEDEIILVKACIEILSSKSLCKVVKLQNKIVKSVDNVIQIEHKLIKYVDKVVKF